MNIASMLELAAYNKPLKKAIAIENDIYNYEEVNKNASKFGNALIRIGVSKGDRIAIFLPNCIEFIEYIFAVFKIGAIALPMNILYKERELKFLLNDSKAKVLITMADKIDLINSFRDDLHSLETIISIDNIDVKEKIINMNDIILKMSDELASIDLSPDDVATILYTSGTTGNPKGAMLTHRNLFMNSEYYADKLGANENWKGLCVLPLSHLLSLAAGVFVLIGRGATMHVMKQFEAEKAASIIEEEKINFIFAVPTVYTMLLALPGNPGFRMKSLEVCIVTGSVTPIELRKNIENVFGCRTIQAYGQVESSPVITMDRIDMERKMESVGYPLPHIQIKIVDNNNVTLPAFSHGEICAKGHCVMKGYWNNLEGTEKTIIDDWLHTGDIGMIDNDGYLYIYDRKKDMIICGGYNVYPKEIEEVLYENEKILEAAVVGVPDLKMGEIPKAFIVPKPNESITEEEIMDYVVNKIAKYKKVRAVKILEALPKGPTGKILKRKLKEFN